MDALKTLCVVTNSLSMPTPMGVPLSLNVSTGAVLKLQGMIKAKSLPELSHFLLRRPFMTRKIEIMADIKPRYHIQWQMAKPLSERGTTPPLSERGDHPSFLPFPFLFLLISFLPPPSFPLFFFYPIFPCVPIPPLCSAFGPPAFSIWEIHGVV